MHYDCVVVGAGFGGLRALYELRALGLTVRLIEAGNDVGGTWHWNRYPGVRTDTESWAYCFSSRAEIDGKWPWTERLPSGNEVRAYLANFVDRNGLRDCIQFEARLTQASYDPASNQWALTLDNAQQYTCTYLVAATGLLTVPAAPGFKGLPRFQGKTYMSMRWPEDGVDFANKSVAIIGSGSTAVQILPLVAETAAKAFLFQRTPNYVLPARNHPLEPEHIAGVRLNHAHLWRNVRAHPVAFPWALPIQAYAAMSPLEIKRSLDAAWEEGGFRFIYNSFADVMSNPAANAEASEYVRQKIRSIVKDPAVAELLCPDHPIGLKRPPLGTNYYETFNKPTVTLVSTRHDPIREITETAIATKEHVFEVDIIVFATGFEAATGALGQIDIRGVAGIPLKSKWLAGPRTNLGIMVDEFPNMFMISGPHSALGNIPPIAEHTAKWIAHAIDRARAAGSNFIEPSMESVETWSEHVRDIYNATPLSTHPELALWQVGSNISGKAPAPLFYFGGADRYCDELDQSIASGLSGFSHSPLGAGKVSTASGA